MYNMHTNSDPSFKIRQLYTLVWIVEYYRLSKERTNAVSAELKCDNKENEKNSSKCEIKNLYINSIYADVGIPTNE